MLRTPPAGLYSLKEDEEMRDCLLCSLTLLALGYSASQLIEPRKVAPQQVCCDTRWDCAPGERCLASSVCSPRKVCSLYC